MRNPVRSHRLLCGDATVITDLDQLMQGRKADLCFTDSPYNVDYTGGVGAKKAGKGRRNPERCPRRRLRALPL